MDFSDSYATGVQVIIVKEGSDVTLDNLGETAHRRAAAAPPAGSYCTDDFGERPCGGL